MQEVISYVCASQTLGQFKDSYGVKSAAAPTLIRGGEYLLRLRLLAGDDGIEPVPFEQLASVVSWEFAMDSDWDSATPSKIIADNGSIRAESVTIPASGERDEMVCTEVSIPLASTNSQQVIDFVGKNESGTGLNAELAGYDGAGKLSYLLQLKGFTIRNRLTSAGSPTEVPETVASRAWVTSLLRAGEEVEVTADGTEWSAYSIDSGLAGFVAMRRRNRSTGGNWSDPIPLIAGPEGPIGLTGPAGPAGAAGAAGATGPEGPAGPAGAGLQIDGFGLLAERPATPVPPSFCYYASDTALAYFWNGSAWSDGASVAGPAGPAGVDGTDGETVISDPAAEFTILHAVYGRCAALDATTPVLSLASPVWDVATVRMRVVSANSAVTGNIVLVPVAAGVELDPVTVAAGAAPGLVSFPLAATGSLAFRRDAANAADTLKDGEAVAALILNLELVIHHEGTVNE